MSSKTFCDRCGQEINYNSRIRIEVLEDGKRTFKDYHVDCFNYEFCCDIRKIFDNEV